MSYVKLNFSRLFLTPFYSQPVRFAGTSAGTFRAVYASRCLIGRALQPLFAFFCDLVTLQTALWFVWNRHCQPAFGHKRLEVIVLKCFTVLYTNECLDFIRLAGLFAELENICRDLSGDLSGYLSGERTLTVLSRLHLRPTETEPIFWFACVCIPRLSKRLRTVSEPENWFCFCRSQMQTAEIRSAASPSTFSECQCHGLL